MKMVRGVFFTLIETLVVISIISILMTILLPALKKARDTGTRIVCMNNMKQIGLANMNYINDYDGFFPDKQQVSTMWAQGWLQINQLAPYLNAKRKSGVYKGTFGTYAADGTGDDWYNATSQSVVCPVSKSQNVLKNYAWNGYVCGEKGIFTKFEKLSQVKLQGQIFLLVDGRNTALDNSWLAPPGEIDYRHSGWTNVLWVDGHVNQKSPFLSYSEFY